MSIGIGIFLIVAGAIVAFALPGLEAVGGVEWSMIGYILILAGAIIAVISLILAARGRKSASVTQVSTDANGNQVRATESKDNLGVAPGNPTLL